MSDPSTPSESSLVFDGLTFFTETGALRRGPAATAGGDLPALAARLLALPSAGARPARSAGWPWSAQARLDTARVLLAEAVACDRAGDPRRAEERWAWLEDEWAWIGQSRRAGKVLARELGGTEAERALLLQAVHGELFPVLHCQAVIAAVRHGQLAQVHERWMEGLSLGAGAPPGLVVHAALAAAALGEMIRPVPVACLEPVVRAVTGKLLPPRAERALLSYFLGGFAHTIAKQQTPDRLLVLIEQLEKLSEGAGRSMALAEALSIAHTVLAARRAAAFEGIAAYQLLGKALLYDPTNDGARKQRARLRDLRAQGIPWQHYSVMAQRFNEADQAVQQLADGPMGRRIQGRFHAALEHELAERLGLDDGDPRHLWVLNGLVQHLERTRSLPEPARTEAIYAAGREWPELAPSIDAVVGAMDKLRDAPVILLGMVLPFRAPPSCARLAPAPEADGAPPPARSRTLFRAWLGSSRDLAFKVAFAAGLALALHGSARVAFTRLARWRQDRAYDAMLSAAQARDDQAAIAAGSTFLSVTGRGEDPRRPQVRRLVSEALLRQVASAVGGGRAGDARELVLAHAALLEPHPGDSRSGEVTP